MLHLFWETLPHFICFWGEFLAKVCQTFQTWNKDISKYNQFITILFLQLNALVGYLLKYIGLLCLISGILQTEGVNLENLGLPVSTTSRYSAVNNSAHYGKVAILGFHSHRYLCMGKNGHIYTRVSTSLIHGYIVWWHTKLYSWVIVTQNYFHVA